MTMLLEKCFRFRNLIYLLLIATAYSASIHVPYYFDDIHSVIDNSALKFLENWYQHWLNPELTSSLPSNRSYRPMTFMIYNFLMVIGDGSPVPFHIHKLLLLFGICILIERVWNHLFSGRPYFGFSLACLWAVHPALSESVTYITATSSLQAAFFYFLGFWFFLKYPQRLLPVGLAYAASCFSKEEGITLPAMIAVWTWSQGRLKSAFRSVTVLSLLGIALFVFIQSRIPAVQSVSRGDVPPLEYLYTQIRAWVHYQCLWLWPVELNADNTVFGFSKSFFDPTVLLSFFLQAGLSVAIWFNRKKHPLIWFGWIWYYVTISPASSVIPLAEPVNERRMLIAYLGFTGIVHYVLWIAAEKFLRFRRFWIASFATLLIASTVACRYRVQTWLDPISLWTDVVDKNPGSVRALNNLASQKINIGDYEGALVELKKCIEIRAYLYCKINEGIALTQLHRYQEARAAYEYATQNAGDIAAPHFYFGYYWFELAEYKKALEEVEIALKISAGTHQPSLDLKNQILERFDNRR